MLSQWYSKQLLVGSAARHSLFKLQGFVMFEKLKQLTLTDIAGSSLAWLLIYFGSVHIFLTLSDYGAIWNDYIGSILLGFVGPAAGAGFGAYYAFLLNASKEDKSQALQEKLAFNDVTFTFIRILTGMYNVKMGSELAVHSTEFERAFKMPHESYEVFEGFEFSFGLLTFLYEKNPSLLTDLDLLQNQFSNLLGAVNERNDYLRTEILPVVAGFGLDIHTSDLKTIVSKFSIAKRKYAISGAKIVFDRYEDVVKTLLKINFKLKEYSANNFPGEKLLIDRIAQNSIEKLNL